MHQHFFHGLTFPAPRPSSALNRSSSSPAVIARTRAPARLAMADAARGPVLHDVPHPRRPPERTPWAEGGQGVVYRPSRLGSRRDRPYGGPPGRRVVADAITGGVTQCQFDSDLRHNKSRHKEVSQRYVGGLFSGRSSGAPRLPRLSASL